MTLKNLREALRACHERVRLRAAALVRAAAPWLADAVGWVGLGMLGQGLRLQYGDPVALMVVGGVLMAVSFLAALRGGG